MVSETGIEIKKTLLDGKPFQKIIDHARKTNPWLIVLGGLASTARRTRRAWGATPRTFSALHCDVLLSTRLEVPRLDLRAEETVRWTPEAEARMTHVPEQVKGIARTGVLRLALEKGHSVITSAVIDEAMDRFMPKSASAATKALAEAVAFERAKSGPVSMCRACGVTATQSGPVKCTVCGATDFEVIAGDDREDRGGGRRSPGGDHLRRAQAPMVGGSQEGPLDHEERLSAPSREGACRKARAHEEARRDHARIRPSGDRGGDRSTARYSTGGLRPAGPPSPSLAGTPSPRSAPAGTPAGVRLIARDDKKNPLISAFDWTDEATQRIFRVPAGFMRSQTQERIEELARERGAASIDLALVEAGIEIGKRMMAEMIATYQAPGKSPATAAQVPADPSAAAPGAPAPEAPGTTGSGYLNEVSALSARRID